MKCAIFICLLGAQLFSSRNLQAQAYSDNEFAQHSDSTNKSFSIGLRGHYSYIFVHAQDLIPNDDYYPLGVELDFNWHLVGERVWSQCNCYPRTGFLLSYFNFGNPIVLGNGYTVAYYAEPFINVFRKINFSLRGAAGFSYLTRPYDEQENPLNQAYSMTISGYLQLNFGVSWRINEHWNSNVSLNMNHVSNGGFKEPNKGLNFPSLSVSADYTLRPVEFIKRDRTPFGKEEKKKLWKEFSVFWSSRAITHGEKVRYSIFGISAGVNKQVSKINALTAGAEWLIDYSLKEKLERAGYAERDYQRVGILLGNEFLMGRFTFSQQLGIYIYNPAQFSDFGFKHHDPVYQRYGLEYKINKVLKAGINLKSHREVANFMDVRMGAYF